MKKRIVILGLDGGSWDCLDFFMSKGVMPNLKELIQAGVSGISESVVPPVTAPAWSSFQTGVNPGKHGVYDFVKYRQGIYSTTFVNSKDIGVKTIWDIASDAGKKIISVNVPMTYPPSKIRGIIISGLMTPNKNCRFTYPDHLLSEIEKEIGDYQIFVDPALYWEKGCQHFVDRCIHVEKKRLDAALYLMRKYDWDLFMLHNQSIDAIQHKIWHSIKRDNPDFDIKEHGYMIKFYKAVD